jgi:hypothetical protein
MLASANAGGENVHRGSVLGALLGAHAGLSGIPAPLVDGLVAHDELKEEVDALALLSCSAPVQAEAGL